MKLLAGTDPTQIASYRLLAVLGEDELGRIYLARSLKGRLVTIKVVHRDLAEAPGFRDAFSREARAASAIDGSFTTPVVDFGPEHDLPWVACEFIAAPTLDEVIAATGPLQERTVLALAAGLARALDAVYKAEVVNYDLTPGNILVTAEGPRLVISGIPRRAPTSAEESADPPSEQAASKQAASGQAADVYSLGEVLYFATTGTESLGHAWLPSDTGYRLSGLIKRCLARKPEKRPTTFEILAKTRASLERRWLFNPAASYVESHVRKMEELTSPSWDAGETLDPPASSLRERLTRLPKRFQALILVAVLLAGGFLGIRATSDDEEGLPGSVEIKGLEEATQLVAGHGMAYLLGAFGEKGDYVVALDPRSGRRRWESRVASRFGGAQLQLFGNILFVVDRGSGERGSRPRLVLLNARNGGELAYFPIDGEEYCTSTRPLNGQAIVGYNEQLRGFDMRTGRVAWIDSTYDGACPDVTKDRLYTFYKGTLHGDTAPYGKGGWEIDLWEASNRRETWRGTDDGVFVVGAKPSAPTLRAYSKEGRLRWETPLPSKHGVPGVSNGLLPAGDSVMVSAENGVSAFHTATGRLRWQAHTVIPDGPPFLAGSIVYTTTFLDTHQTMLSGLDLNSGKVLWQTTLGHDVIVATTDHRGIYASANSTADHTVKEPQLLAIDPGTGRQRWRLNIGMDQLTAANGHLYAVDGDRFVVLDPLTGRSPA